MNGARTAAAWLTRKERGNASLMRFMVWITLRLGRPVARLFLPVIVIYFIVFSPSARAAGSGKANMLCRPRISVEATRP